MQQNIFLMRVHDFMEHGEITFKCRYVYVQQRLKKLHLLYTLSCI